ncbi:hypothetical protein DN062_07065 [Nitrincola tibetensis]|uniref:Uncharacterized protein n=1 Tax=Nitrincola tibetensis TaxID=2219697 RepID=A0A364NN43_9GAMM|nr:hypothetical protein [Nitrincola tibetensis]RAU18526.1 hypothetical protein DN062_07065 [Nitrincola tibetensis]
MATMVAGAPLLAGGPPGWIAYAGLGVLTMSALILARNSTNTASQTSSSTREGTQECRRPWSVRVHAQGNIIGGHGRATLGAPAIVKPPSPVTVPEGLTLSASTYGMLTKRQKKRLSRAYEEAIKWIEERPPSGMLEKKSFYVAREESNDRIDVDSFGCTPNFIS